MVVIYKAGIHMESIHMGGIHMGAMITITATVTGVQVKDRGWGMAAGCCSYQIFVTSLCTIKVHRILLKDSNGMSVPVLLCNRLQSASVAPVTEPLASCLYIVVYVTGLLMHATVRAGSRLYKRICSVHVSCCLSSTTCENP